MPSSHEQTAGPLVYWGANLQKGEGFRDHIHDHDHVIGVVTGSIQIGLQGRTWIYQAGQMATMRAGIKHEVRALEDGSEIVAARMSP